jgi:cytochrome c-type biogenesis protein CcmH
MNRVSRQHFMRPRITVALLLALLSVAVVVVALTARSPAHPPIRDRVQGVASQLRCPVCQGESVWDSPAPLAQAMRDIIRKKLQSGESDSAIRDYFVTKYGPWILLAPPASGVGVLVWLGPPALLVLGLCLLVYLAYRWRRHVRPRLDVDVHRSSEDLNLALERLDDSLDESIISETEYQSQREVLMQSLSAASSLPSQLHGHGRRKTWIQAGAMAITAVLIAVSVTLAIQPRGTGPITGSIASSSAPPATPPVPASIPSDVRSAVRRVEASPKSPVRWSALGAVLLLHREFSQARAAYRYALRFDHRNEAANLGLAFINIGNGKYGKSLQELNAVMTRDPRSTRLWLLLGLAYSKQPGGYNRAIRAWSHFLHLTPKSPVAGQVRGWITNLKAGKPAP